MRSPELIDPGGRSFTVKEKLLYWTIIFFFATLFLPPQMPVFNDLAIGAVIAVCFIYNPPAQKFHLLRTRKAVVCMLLFFLIELISAAASSNQSRAWFAISVRSTLLIFPLTIGLIIVRQELKNHILFAFAVLITAVALCCLTDAIHRTWVRHDTQWLYDDSLTILIGRTSVYMALLVVLAIASLTYLLEIRFIVGRRSWWIYGCLGFLLVVHFLLASRISLFFLYTVIVIYLGWHISNHRRSGRMLLLAAGVFALVVASFFLFPKTLNRFRQLQYTSYNYRSQSIESHYNMPVTPDQWNGANFRLAVWSCGLDIARKHPVTGVPLGDKQAMLMTEYKARDFMFAYERQRNLHSTWLDVLVNTGIPGLAIFLLGFLIFPVVAATASRDWLGLIIIMAFAAAMITETWIDGSFGTILLAFWLSLVSAWKNPQSARARTGSRRLDKPAR